MFKSIYIKKPFNFLLVIFFTISFFNACNLFSRDEIPTVTDLPDFTPTPAPTLAPDRAVLAASAGISQAEIANAQTFIASLAAEYGLEFETRDTIISNEITPDVKIIIFLEQPDNLGSLAASAPDTQFVAISSQEWNPPANGNVIRINNDHAAFLAGYLGAMLAPNFRAGALQVSEAVTFNQAFNHGVSYYCGICAAQVYPLNTYPVTSQQPAGSLPVNWQTAFNEINTNKVNVLFLPEEAITPEFGTFLAGQDVAIISNASPVEEIQSKWAATIKADGLTALREMWPDLINGIGGKIINAGLRLTDLNYVNVTNSLVGLSQGKMMQVDELIQLLRDDQIYPYAVME